MPACIELFISSSGIGHELCKQKVRLVVSADTHRDTKAHGSIIHIPYVLYIQLLTLIPFQKKIKDQNGATYTAILLCLIPDKPHKCTKVSHTFNLLRSVAYSFHVFMYSS